MGKVSILIAALIMIIITQTVGTSAQDITLDLSWDFGTSNIVLPCSPFCVTLQGASNQTGTNEGGNSPKTCTTPLALKEESTEKWLTK